jgi:phenylacetate-CoA ligase
MNFKQRPIVNPGLKWFLSARSSRQKITTEADFYKIKLETAKSNYISTKPQVWQRRGSSLAIQIFHSAARRVPAYKDFLKKHRINPALIRTIKDYGEVPWTDKKNYFREYPLDSLCWDGDIAKQTIFSVSSGSSGKPFLWPRNDNLEIETSVCHGLILTDFFDCATTPSLFIDTFSMGIYIAGVVILNSALRVAQSGCPVSIITPGVEINDILRVFKELSPYYKQVIIAGYPPFVRDVLKIGLERGIKWKQKRIRFLFAAENFSEDFRNYVHKLAGITVDSISESINIYGSAEASIMAHETPLSIALRKAASKNQVLFRKLFNDYSFLPTFTQYNPTLKYFENSGRELLLTSFAGLPLVRYNLHDEGFTREHEELKSSVRDHMDSRLNLLFKNSWKLPFLAVKGKSDFTISFYGLKIYPENIKGGLEDSSVRALVSGRFVMSTARTLKQEQYWQIDVELTEKVKPNNSKQMQVLRSILRNLRRQNLEFNKLFSSIGNKALPVIRLYEKSSSKMFDAKAIKQRWLKKDEN